MLINYSACVLGLDLSQITNCHSKFKNSYNTSEQEFLLLLIKKIWLIILYIWIIVDTFIFFFLKCVQRACKCPLFNIKKNYFWDDWVIWNINYKTKQRSCLSQKNALRKLNDSKIIFFIWCKRVQGFHGWEEFYWCVCVCMCVHIYIHFTHSCINGCLDCFHIFIMFISITVGIQYYLHLFHMYSILVRYLYNLKSDSLTPD